MNPIDLLGVHPGGAEERPLDLRDYDYHSPEIGMASPPFDWSIGFDVEKELGYTAPTKDQKDSYSCGGQTVSQQAQALSVYHLNHNEEMSAKAYYSQVFVPGGGSNSRNLGDTLVKQGLYKESLVPSYDHGKPPSEKFMTRPQDISAKARQDASLTANMFAYAFPVLNIDTMAQALRDRKNLLIGIRGSNNGTWLSSFPSAKKEGDYWQHFMFGGKARLENGKKTIWAKQSWGKRVAPETNSYQAITEDHFAAGQVWDAMVFLKAERPQEVKASFNEDIVFGSYGPAVYMLQNALAKDGVFNLKATGHYGALTARAVLKFRKKHGIDSSTDPKGYVAGPRTRAVLNAIFS